MDDDDGASLRYRYGHQPTGAGGNRSSQRWSDATGDGDGVRVQERYFRKHRKWEIMRDHSTAARAELAGSYDDEWRHADRATAKKHNGDRCEGRQYGRCGARPVNYMKPGKFDGTVSIDTFLIQFETTSEYNKWSDTEKCANLKCLTGHAGQILREMGDPSGITYTELVEKLKARYGSAGQKEMFISQLRSRRRKQCESLAELHRDIRRLMAMAYPNTAGSDLNEEIAKSHFIAALGDRDLELKVKERDPPTLDAAFSLAVRLEACLDAYREEDRRDARAPRTRQVDHPAGRVAAVGQGSQGSGTVEREIAELRGALRKEKEEREAKP